MIKRIFTTIWPIIKEKCSSNDMEKELQEKYMSYLTKQYEGSLELMDKKDEDFVSKYIESIINDEREKITELSSDELISCFDGDEAYNSFLLLSSEVFEKARRKKAHVLLDSELEEYEMLKSKIITSFNDVSEMNKGEASEILSEMLVEIDYIYGLSELESLRLSHEFVDGFGEDAFGEFGEFDLEFKVDGE